MRNKIKVSLIIFSKFPVNGGYENLVYDLAEKLSSKAKIQLVCTEITTEKPIPNLIEVFPILNQSKIRYIGFFFSNIINMINFYNYLRKERPDVINAHPSFPAGFIALLPAKLLNIPLICTSHGGDIQLNKEVGYGMKLNKFTAFLLKITLKGTNIHTVVSKSMIKAAVDSGSEIPKIYTIENGINLQETGKTEVDILKKYKIEKNEFIILFLGRLIPVKRPEDLIKAFSLIYNKIPKSRLIIAGSGNEESKLRKLISDLNISNRVILTGFVSPKTGKWDLLERCDISVSPSLVEGLPIATLEAFSYGKPVIATNIKAFTEIIKNMETGILVKPKSPEELSKAILELAKNKEKRLIIGKRAKKEFNVRFNIQKTAEEYLKLYEKVSLVM
jgi:glycosyltransferase involved in cell wall biosynthesis